MLRRKHRRNRNQRNLFSFLVLVIIIGISFLQINNGFNHYSNQYVEQANVIRVIDGDTILVNLSGIEERVRFIGVDAPEVGEYGSDQATEFVQMQIDSVGGIVWLTGSGNDRDRFGRLRRYVWLAYPTSESISFNQMLIDNGYTEMWE